MSNNNPISDLYEEAHEENKDIDTYIDKLKISNPVKALRMKMFEFFSTRLDVIQKSSALKDLLEKDLIDDLVNGKMSTTQKIALWNDLAHKEIQANNSIFDILKPTPNAPSLLDSSADEKSPEQDAFNNLKKEDNEALQNMNLLLEAIKASRVKLAEEAEVIKDTEGNVN